MFKLCCFFTFLSLGASQYTPCANESNAAIVGSISASGCDVMAKICTLYSNANNPVTLTFTPAINAANLYASATVIYNNQAVSLPISPSNWCDGANVCPITAGKSVTIKQNLALNQNISGEQSGSFYLRGDNNATVVCLGLKINWARK